MTDKELRKLGRTELLELLLEQSREVERLKAYTADLEEKLKSRELKIAQSGSIAEAALQVNGVYEAAQQAAEQYLENIRKLNGEQEAVCARMEAETAEKCRKMVQDAQSRSQAYWDEVSRNLNQFMEQHAGLKELLSMEAVSQ